MSAAASGGGHFIHGLLGGVSSASGSAILPAWLPRPSPALSRPSQEARPIMFDSLSEAAGCDLLAKVFRARGYTIARNLQFREYGVEFHVDGWDAKARVGFEYLSSEDDDHDDLSVVEYQALMEQQRRGELSLFVIDEVEPISAADLEEQANEFLDEVEAARASRRAAGARKAGVKATMKPAKKAAAKKPVAKKPAVKRVAKPAAAAQKPAAKKKLAKRKR